MMSKDSALPQDHELRAEEDAATAGLAADDEETAPLTDEDSGSSVRQAKFLHLYEQSQPNPPGPLDLVLDVELQVTAELGRASMQIRDVLGLGPGSVVELDKMAGEPVDLLVNGRPFARGEVVVIDESFGVRVTEILSPTERISSLR